tara:strand:+ start:348 stop:485 length:138 start_codon:yes stop_codon:yes gene_type:complete
MYLKVLSEPEDVFYPINTAGEQIINESAFVSVNYISHNIGAVDPH